MDWPRFNLFCWPNVRKLQREKVERGPKAVSQILEVGKVPSALGWCKKNEVMLKMRKRLHSPTVYSVFQSPWYPRKCRSFVTQTCEVMVVTLKCYWLDHLRNIPR